MVCLAYLCLIGLVFVIFMMLRFCPFLQNLPVCWSTIFQSGYHLLYFNKVCYDFIFSFLIAFMWLVFWYLDKGYFVIQRTLSDFWTGERGISWIIFVMNISQWLGLCFWGTKIDPKKWHLSGGWAKAMEQGGGCYFTQLLDLKTGSLRK